MKVKGSAYNMKRFYLFLECSGSIFQFSWCLVCEEIRILFRLLRDIAHLGSWIVLLVYCLYVEVLVGLSCFACILDELWLCTFSWDFLVRIVLFNLWFCSYRKMKGCACMLTDSACLCIVSVDLLFRMC